MKRKLFKLLVFNLLLSGACIFIISDGFLGVNMSAPGIGTKLIFLLVVLAAILLFITVNYRILVPPKPKKVKLVDGEELKSPKDYIRSLQSLLYKKEFANYISVLIGQINRISPKQASLGVILEQNFEKTELTYIKFTTTINEVVGLFYENIKKAINRIGVFDEEEYHKLLRNELALPEDSKQLKIQIYGEHLSYVDGIIRQNEVIITLLDNLMLEISKLDGINGQSMENLQILAEMKELIKNTKYYGN
ncbi:MAG: hypothetical protein K6C14_02115 [Eubacterium sp.]|nr:hypothetical protein [Eubacterium sp.]